MHSIVTLTANPAIDVSTEVGEIAPVRKLRCASARRDAGGGGINVARVVRRLGSDVAAVYPAGGVTGSLLERLVAREGVASVAIAVKEETREDFTVLERNSGQQFRFVLPGAPLAAAEWQACLDALAALDSLAATPETPSFLVCSGSLPPGVPEDFYARACALAKTKGACTVVDTSGNALAAALREGVYLIKPNLRELQELTHASLAEPAERVKACRMLIDSGGATAVALTLGAAGALLVAREAAYFARAPQIEAVSAVGAGDSFLGAMVWRLAGGGDLVEAFRHGLAAGTAAVLNQGTELCHPADVQRLCEQVTLLASC
jgi:6-phosphofructokinase 2